MTNTFVHGYSLLIGVGECAYPKWSLPVTVKDVQAIQACLTNPSLCGYINDNNHIRLLRNAEATSGNILNGLNWLSQQASADPEATVLVYYSGHGWLDEFTGKYYLIPHDIVPFNLPNSALSAQYLTDALRQIQAKRLLVIIDSCHAEGMASAKNGQAIIKLPPHFVSISPPKSLIDDLKQSNGRAVFTSCRGKQSSWIRPDGKMSIYTYHLIEALQGAGSQSGDTVVRLSQLMNYVSQAVPKSSQSLCHAEQTPFFDFSTEDFAVALLNGGKGLVSAEEDAVKAQDAATISNVTADGEVMIIAGNQQVTQSGSGNINIGQARDITIGSKALSKD
jgi:uncharacterized caspase-like protein